MYRADGEDMYLIFYKTYDVFLAEEKLNANKVNCKIVPTPVQDKAYCGVCLEIDEQAESDVTNALTHLEYKVVK